MMTSFTLLLAVAAPAEAPAPSAGARPSVTLRLQTPDGKVARKSPHIKWRAESIANPSLCYKVVKRPEVARLPLIKAQKAPGFWLYRQLQVQSDEQEATLVLRMRAGDAATQAVVLNAVAAEALAIEEVVRKRWREDVRFCEGDLKITRFTLAQTKKELQKELARRVGVNGEPDAKKVDRVRKRLQRYERAIKEVEAQVKRLQHDLRTTPRCVIVRKAKIPQGDD
jgi:hypothetical protein